MNPTRLEDMAALDAAGALGRPERFELRSRLATASQQEGESVASRYDVAILLALALPMTVPPSAAVRRRLMARLKGASADEPGVKTVTAGDGRWEAGSTDTVLIKRLGGGVEEGHVVLLLELAPGAQFPSHSHAASEELFVVDGDVLVGARRLGPGDFQQAEPGTVHPPLRTLQGCRLLLVVSALDYVERWSS
jgi:anti-sigma factor ChrR (cupin superfamily)